MGVLRFLSTRRSYFRQRIAVHQHFASFREVKIPTVRKIATRLRKSRSQKGSPGQISLVVSHSERTKNRAFLIACLRSDKHNAQKMVVLDSFQSARTDRKAAPRPTVRAALLVAPLLLLDFRGFAPNNTTKNQNF